MGTTAQKLSYLNETKTKLKDKINLMGANITDDTFRSYPDKIKDGLLDIMNNGYEKVWNNWSKVTGSGTELTLNNTIEAPMKLDLKGNTSQDTTTGKNLLHNTGTTTTTNGITFTPQEDGSILVNGTATARANYFFSPNRLDLEAGTYTMSSYQKGTTANTDVYMMCYVNDNGNNSYKNSGQRYITFSVSSGAYIQGQFYISVNSGATANNVVVYPQFEKNSTATFYEPYTNGASPNPDYPQDVKVVKEDNVIKIEGKNRFKGYSNMLSGFLPASGSYPTTHGSYPNARYQIIELKQGESITTSGSTSYGGRIRYIDKSTNEVVGSVITQGATANNYYISTGNYSSGFVDGTITAKQDLLLGIMVLEQRTDYEDFQIESGNTATTFEPYTSEEHKISLGVENLWKKIPNGTKNGVTLFYNPDDGSYTLDGTSTSATSFYISASLPIGKYTLSANNEQIMAGGADYLLLETQGGTSTNKTLVFSLANNKATFDVTSPITTLVVVISSGKTYNNFKFYPMLEKGETGHEYCKYGETPIELCKINTYQDKIIGNSGKNLFDDSQNNNNWIAVNGNIISVDGSNMKMFNCKENETFTLSANYVSSNDENIIAMAFYNSDETLLNRYVANIDAQLTITATSPVNTSYIKVAHYSKKPFTIQLEKGSTATDYEPYGSGKWYKKEKVQKTTLTSENSSIITAFGTQNEHLRIMIEKTKLGWETNWLADICLINKYHQIKSINDVESGAFATNFNMASLVIWNDNFVDLEDAKTKLIGTEIYIAKSTPNYILLPDALQEQLNKIVHSKKSQTNISQENDGLPFEIDATALME